MRGVPVRVEMGSKDLEAGVATLVRRDKDKGEDGGKETVALANVATRVRELLVEIQENMLAQARAFLASHTIEATDSETFFRLVRERAGMIDIPWCALPGCEAIVKAQTSGTTRNTRPLEAGANLTCVACGEPAVVRAYFAQSY
jgi:prolyl-tRNA synthetase